VERSTKNGLEARAAVQVTLPRKDAAFGAVWMSAQVNVDRDARIVSFRDVKIPRVRVVDAPDQDKSTVSSLLEREIPTWNLQMGLDQFIPLLDLAQHDTVADAGLKNEPPRIVIANKPSMLVLIDGAPKQLPMTTSQGASQDTLERIVNTPALIVYHPARKMYYLAGGGDQWYAAPQATGPYGPTATVPASVSALVPKADAADISAGKAPEVIVAAEPTELID
jgi:hypothetical protein